MTSLSERLAAAKAKLAGAREDNLKVVQIEKETAPESTFIETKANQRQNNTPYGDINRGKRRRSTHYHSETIDLGSADEADEENSDERLRSLKRRSRALGRSKGYNNYKNESRTVCQENDTIEHREEEDGSKEEKIIYGGEGRVDKEALDDMVNELQDVEKRRAKYRRRRAFDEDRADITFINEGNRLFNKSLDKHFDKFDSVKQIKENLERGTA